MASDDVHTVRYSQGTSLKEIQIEVINENKHVRPSTSTNKYIRNWMGAWSWHPQRV